ncbi:arginase family protein [Amycolatopsis acidicola]|uniref:Arginase family protein n=1 Tax=Amycolatopsis acidicola TaxID=2596893 RepID=A0A5N0V9S1_9PSEU|nr:arginase family protein [Amycolatopsis acidicola]KAA9161820.1 arginase family protein [Amycolatopsis acidicola]
MKPILVPFHQDELLPPETLPVPVALPLAPQLAGTDRWARMAELYDWLADEVAGEIRVGKMPNVVSGDCLVMLGVLAGVQRAGLSPSVLWLDAHGDVHTPESSTSGYLGGMALRFLLGAAPDALGRLGLRPLAEENATLVDARDLDPAEAVYLASAQVRHVPLAEARAPDGPVILHVDVDVIDSGDLPGLRFPVSGGPSKSAVVEAVRAIRAGGNVIATHIACPWIPVQDQENRAALLHELLYSQPVSPGR